MQAIVKFSLGITAVGSLKRATCLLILSPDHLAIAKEQKPVKTTLLSHIQSLYVSTYFEADVIQDSLGADAASRLCKR